MTDVNTKTCTEYTFDITDISLDEMRALFAVLGSHNTVPGQDMILSNLTGQIRIRLFALERSSVEEEIMYTKYYKFHALEPYNSWHLTKV